MPFGKGLLRLLELDSLAMIERLFAFYMGEM